MVSLSDKLTLIVHLGNCLALLGLWSQYPRTDANHPYLSGDTKLEAAIRF